MAIVPNGNRAEDKDTLAKIHLFRERYGFMLWPFILLLIALGFGFRTPKMWYDEMDVKLNKVEDRVTAIEGIHAGLDDKLDVLLKFRCMDPQISERERIIAGLKCDNFTPRVTP